MYIVKFSTDLDIDKSCCINFSSKSNLHVEAVVQSLFLFLGWCDDELPSGWDGDIPTEGHTDPRRFRISGLHHPIRRNRNAGGVHFSWGRVKSLKLSDSQKKCMTITNVTFVFLKADILVLRLMEFEKCF